MTAADRQFHTSREAVEEKLRVLARQYDLSELSLFGSYLTGQLNDTSDVDVLYALKEGRQMTLSTYRDLLEVLENLFGRQVDLVNKKLLINPLRREEILRTRKVIYAA